MMTVSSEVPVWVVVYGTEPDVKVKMVVGFDFGVGL